jgi:cytochrome P450
MATIDLTDATLYRSGVPHDVFRELRDAGAVHRNPRGRLSTNNFEGELEFWSVVRHAEIERVNRDWQTFTAFDGPGLGPTRPESRGHTIVSMDPPEHSRLRRLVSSGFTPRMISELESHIARRSTAILDRAAERGTIEFVSEVAYELPMHVIADIVGIPEGDRPWVFSRTEAMLRALDPTFPMDPSERGVAERDLWEYAQRLSAEKRDHPADDVWTTLTDAEIVGDDGTPTRLTTFELDMFFVILALAGSETTRNALSQGLVALLEHPDQLAALRDDPSLIARATDEIIRWSSPVLFFGRTATCDVELGGELIRAGDRVIMWYPSGNRDERAFDDPFRFDITRSPNPHVSFGGGGPHYCLGANLAKKEVSVLVSQLVLRFAEVELVAPPRWTGGGPTSNVGVSITELPVRLRPR